MHAYLVTGKTQEDRMAEITKRTRGIAAWDIVHLTEPGIAAVREFVRTLPMMRAGVIDEIDRLLPEAQNALLKTIEEPPGHVIIYAGCANADALLPTILSRMQIISVGSGTAAEDPLPDDLVATILRRSAGNTLRAIEPYTTDAASSRTFYRQLVYTFTGKLRSPEGTKIAPILRKLLRVQPMLSVNVNARLALDNALAIM